MALYLIETPIPEGEGTLAPLFDKIADAVQQAQGEVIEMQVGVDSGVVYVIAEHTAPAPLREAFTQAGVPFKDVANVRLVGPTLDEVKAHKSGARYLVEWDLPEGLTMERYLARKKQNAPLYAKVPETTFLRTYVREDMFKCLCFYDAPDEDAVLRAREAVDTPVDRVTRIEGASIDVRA